MGAGGSHAVCPPGRVTAYSAADSGLVALRQGDLVARDLSLELARPYLDTLPFAGRLTGRTIVDGPMSALKIETEWAFRDSLVSGWPETQIHGKGEVNVAGKNLAFQPFEVAAAQVDLGTVRRLVPAFDLNGELDATGTLTGTLKNARFSGTLRHQDGARPPSIVRGVVALDSRSAILGVFADVHTDSLSLEGVTGNVRGFPLRGMLAGTIQMDGNLAALETHADLAMTGGGGSVRGGGRLLLGAPAYGARDFTLRAHDVNLKRWLVSGPPSRLAFTATGSGAGRSPGPPSGPPRGAGPRPSTSPPATSTSIRCACSNPACSPGAAGRSGLGVRSTARSRWPSTPAASASSTRSGRGSPVPGSPGR